MAISKTRQSRRVIRRFTLLDAMIFTAASGLGFYHISSFMGDASLSVRPKTFYGHLVLIFRYTHFIIPLMLLITISALIVRLRRPRPPVRRILRQPGAIACAAAVAVAVLESVRAVVFDVVWLLDSANDVFAVFARKMGSWDWADLLWSVYWNLPTRIGHTVTVIWLVLILSGRWYPARDWIDRLGRILGAFWIVVGVLWWLETY
jgi:hypothetical protein